MECCHKMEGILTSKKGSQTRRLGPNDRALLDVSE